MKVGDLLLAKPHLSILEGSPYSAGIITDLDSYRTAGMVVPLAIVTWRNGEITSEQIDRVGNYYEVVSK